MTAASKYTHQLNEYLEMFVENSKQLAMSLFPGIRP